MNTNTVLAGVRSSLTTYGVSLAAVAVAVVARLLLEPLLADRLPFITLFLAVGFAAWYGGRGPGLMALVAGAVAVAFFLTQPRYSFAKHTQAQGETGWHQTLPRKMSRTASPNVQQAFRGWTK